MENSTEKSLAPVSEEQLEEATGGAQGSVLNGPFCCACGSELIFANGSYKCMKIGCKLQGQPQDGYYNQLPQ